MVFDPECLLEVARRQLAGAPSEEHCRTAVNRAYYARFLLARNAMGLQGEKFSVHKKTLDRLYAIDPDLKDHLDTLRMARSTSDYEMGAQVTQWWSQWHVQYAEEFIADLRARNIL